MAVFLHASDLWHQRFPVSVMREQLLRCSQSAMANLEKPKEKKAKASSGPSHLRFNLRHDLADGFVHHLLQERAVTVSVELFVLGRVLWWSSGYSFVLGRV